MPAMNHTRRLIIFNDNTKSIPIHANLGLAQQFHRQLPGYTSTPLIPLEDVASKLGVKSIFVKDESSRLGLPAFKILGASWGSCRAIIAKSGIAEDSSLQDIAHAARQMSTTLITASAGNHGRALAAMARILEVPAQIFVPRTVSEQAIQLISSEGAQVTVSDQDYDGAIKEAWDEAKAIEGGLFIQDTAFDNYSEIPQWIVEGYSTLLAEVEEQLQNDNLKANLIVTPVGVGSLAHAVVRHCKSNNRQCAVMTVEPDTAPCLYHSLKAGKLVSVSTSKTIMEGMNCGTVSSTAFNDLQSGVDASMTISDFESYQATKYLAERSVSSGPCGGAAFAALRRLADTPSRPSWLNEDAVVVILSTEGQRHHDIPLDTSISDPDLLQAPGVGEEAVWR
ncbi:unnamed protein product [Periconia digitata]|uniref:Tryptophan synthase beta chain-like PALP domain-containing protein n=1 Tax=Periconia digitata TaxID=1303443 RepID=A0A9W4XNS1_9PLEO|nr:unnamed protein product [Periconia digitata]